MFRISDFDRFWNWPDFDRALTMLDTFRREVERSGGGPTAGVIPRWGGRGTWLNANVEDKGAEYVFYADVPGLVESDVDVLLNQDVLTVKGTRTVDVPEGYSVHRRERAATEFSRSFTLPAMVDAERTTARVQNGVLTVTMPKLPEAQPRQITIKGE